jgi:lipopolysaccharide export LptBFGC system permease protein LptF
LASHTSAHRASYAHGTWQAEEGWVQRFPTADRVVREPFARRSLKLALPETFSGAHNESADVMTFSDLRKHIAGLARSGINVAESKVQLQERVAFPLVTVVMTVLGVPFGLTLGRRGALYGIGLAMVLGAGYWLLNTFFAAVGRADLLPAALAAWATNVLFLALALYAALTART